MGLMTNASRQQASDVGAPARRQGHAGHGLLMIACCVPMIAITIALVAAGVLSAGFLLAAIACTPMMALMMRGMSDGHGQQRK